MTRWLVHLVVLYPLALLGALTLCSLAMNELTFRRSIGFGYYCATCGRFGRYPRITVGMNHLRQCQRCRLRSAESGI